MGFVGELNLRNVEVVFVCAFHNLDELIMAQHKEAGQHLRKEERNKWEVGKQVGLCRKFLASTCCPDLIFAAGLMSQGYLGILTLKISCQLV